MANKSNPLDGHKPAKPLMPPTDPVAYEKWVDEQIEAGLKEADTPNAVFYTNDEVFAALEERRAEWRVRASKQRNVA
jgi:hypothetical protein